MSVRHAVVSGSFYPAHSHDLARQVSSLIQSANSTSVNPPKVIVAPQANYQYSGHIAAEAFHTLIDHQDSYSRVVMLGPALRCSHSGIAAPGDSVFETPLGEIEVDQDVITGLEQSTSVRISQDVHQIEYCLEVQLPFLQSVLSDFKFVPLIIGECAPKQIIEVLNEVWGGDETLIVISTDMSRYLFDNDARRKDQATIGKVKIMEPKISADEACGYRALNAALVLAKEKGLVVRDVRSCNSSSVTGNRDNVTGYASFILCQEDSTEAEGLV